MDLNKIMIIGRITQKPEKKVIPSGQGVASFSVATNRTWNDASGQKQEQVEFHNIVAWGKLADICEKFLDKGKKVYIEGRMQTRSWDGQDGVKRYKTEVIASNLIMLDRAGNSDGFTPSAPNNNVVVESASEQVVEKEIQVDDIPF